MAGRTSRAENSAGAFADAGASNTVDALWWAQRPQGLDQGGVRRGHQARLIPGPERDLRANAFRVCREGKPVSTPPSACERLFPECSTAGIVCAAESLSPR